VTVLVIANLQGDTVKFRQALADRGDEFAKIAEAARSAGAIHHRFAIGDGFVLVQDEWDSAEHLALGPIAPLLLALGPTPPRSV
jgi:hypothetical protein